MLRPWFVAKSPALKILAYLGFLLSTLCWSNGPEGSNSANPAASNGACHGNLIIALGGGGEPQHNPVQHISLPPEALRLLNRVSTGTTHVEFFPTNPQSTATQVVFPLGAVNPPPNYESIFGQHLLWQINFDLLPRTVEARIVDPRGLLEAVRLTRYHGVWVFISNRSPDAVGSRLPSGHMFSLMGDLVISRNSNDQVPFDVLDLSTLDWERAAQKNSLSDIFPSPFDRAEWTTATFLEFGPKETAILSEAMRARTQDPSLVGKYLPLPTHKHYRLSVSHVTSGETENCTYSTFAFATTRMRQRFPQLVEIVRPMGTGLTLQDLPLRNISTVAELPNARGTFVVLGPTQSAP